MGMSVPRTCISTGFMDPLSPRVRLSISSSLSLPPSTYVTWGSIRLISSRVSGLMSSTILGMRSISASEPRADMRSPAPPPLKASGLMRFMISWMATPNLPRKEFCMYASPFRTLMACTNFSLALSKLSEFHLSSILISVKNQFLDSAFCMALLRRASSFVWAMSTYSGCMLLCHILIDLVLVLGSELWPWTSETCFWVLSHCGYIFLRTNIVPTRLCMN